MPAQAGEIRSGTRFLLPPVPRRSVNMKILYSVVNLAKKTAFTAAVTRTHLDA